MFETSVPYISLHKTLETKTNKQYLYDLSYVFIELGKFNKNQLASTTDKWLHLFKCAEKENSPPANIKSEKVLDAYNVIEMHNLTPEEYDAYIRAKLMEDAEEMALSENFEKGVKTVAREMLINNEPLEKIIKYAKLTKEEIEKLQEELEKSKKYK